MDAKEGLELMVKELLEGYSLEAVTEALLKQVAANRGVSITSSLLLWRDAMLSSANKAMSESGNSLEELLEAIEVYAKTKHHYCGAVKFGIAEVRAGRIPKEVIGDYLDMVKKHIDEEAEKGHVIDENSRVAGRIFNMTGEDVSDQIFEFMRELASQFGGKVSPIDPDDIVEGEGELPEVLDDNFFDNLFK